MNQLQEQEFELLVEFDRICRKNNIKYMLSSGTLLGAIRHQGFIPWDDDIDICMTRLEYDKFIKASQNDLNSDMFLQTRDTDIDYYHAFAKLRSNKYELKEISSGYLRSHQGVWLDIFPMDVIPNDSELQKRQKNKVNLYNKLISLMIYTFPVDEDPFVKKAIKTSMQTINRVFFRINPLLSYFYGLRHHWLTKYTGENSDYLNMLTYNFNNEVYLSTLIESASFDKLLEHQFESSKFYIPTNYEDILTRLYGNYMKLPPVEEQISNHFIID